MKNMFLHPSSSADHFPLTSFPKNLPSSSIFNTDAGAQFLPYANLQSLKLGLESKGASELFIPHVDSLLENF